MNKCLMAAALVSMTALAGCGGDKDTGTFDEQAFLDEIRTEPSIAQASITKTGNIYVAVPDNGNDRKGFAGYVCEVSRDFASGEISNKLVKVVDQRSVGEGSNLVELGRHSCEY